ncbi:MAG: DMT family transporter, partial [Deltaproteobacteria bacterium]|nr:DMT family transporter [Deltaproteobacteria bacterium]
SWAVYTVLAKPLTPLYSTPALNYSTLTVGSLPFLCLVDRDLIRQAASLDGLEILAWIFLSIFCTIIAFQLWLFGIKHWRASNASLFVFLNPPLTAVFAYLFFGRLISGWFFVGGLGMLAGILLAVTGDMRAKTRPGPTVPNPADRL